MTLSAYNSKNSCENSAKGNRNAKQKCHLCLFPAKDLSELFAMVIIDPLPKTTKNIPRVVIFRKRYSELTRAVLTTRLDTNNLDDIFFYTWVIPCGLPAYL